MVQFDIKNAFRFKINNKMIKNKWNTKLLYAIIFFVAGSVIFFYLGILYQNNKKVPVPKNDYDSYVSESNPICPDSLLSTMAQSDCLDKQIQKQQSQYNSLSANVLDMAKNKEQ